jgi:hypothetical protein
MALCPATSHGQASLSPGVRGSAYDTWGGGVNMSAQAGADLGYNFDVGPINVRPHIGAWVAYDDNVYADEADAEEDYYLTVAPGVLAVYGNPSQNYISANYTAEIVRYADADDEDYVAHNISADLHYEFAKSTLHIADRYIDTVARDPDADAKVESRRNYLTADLERYISSKTSVAINGRYEIHDYVRDDYVDYDEYRAGGRFYYRIRPKTDIFGDIGYGWVDLETLNEEQNEDLSRRFDLDIDESYGDAEYVQASLGVRGELGRKTKASGRLGYEHRDFYADSIEDIDEWISTFAMTTKFTSRFDAGVEVSRAIYPWTTVPGNSAVSTVVSPYIRRQFYGNKLALTGTGSFEWADYYDADGKTEKSEEVMTLTALLDWKLTHATIGGGYSYTETESKPGGEKTERDRFLFRVMVNY